MRDSVPSARYSPIRNVLRQWKTSLIPIYSKRHSVELAYPASRGIGVIGQL